MKISDEEIDKLLENLKKGKHQEKLSDEFKEKLIMKMEEYAKELDKKEAEKRNKKITFCGGIKSPKLLPKDKNGKGGNK